MGFLEVWADVFHCKFFMVETACGDYGSAFLWGQLYLEVDFCWHTAEVARRKKFTGGRGMSINIFSWRRYLLIIFVCKQPYVFVIFEA